MESREKLILEIFALAYLVQVNTEYCVFINYAGHVDSFEVDIRESKERWQNEVYKTEFRTLHLARLETNKDNPLNWLIAKRDLLKEILETKSIPYEEMTEHIEQIRTYEF